MPDLPPAAANLLRQGRPELPKTITAMVPNMPARKPPTVEQALYIIEQYMVTAVQASHAFDVVTVTAVRENGGLTIRVVPADQ